MPGDNTGALNPFGALYTLFVKVCKYLSCVAVREFRSS